MILIDQYTLGVVPAPVRLLPSPPDPLYLNHIEGLRNRRLVVRVCMGCGRKQWPPRHMCVRCHAKDLQPTAIPDRGVIYTYNVVHRGFDPYFVQHTPYAVVIVDLGDGIRMVGNWAGTDLTQIGCGVVVRAEFLIEDGNPFLAWIRAAREGVK